MPRLAWFTPLPPVRSGIAGYSADLLPLVAGRHEIDVFVDGGRSAAADNRRRARLDCCPVLPAEDFVWRHRQRSYDLIVYQLGNAGCHDYMWPYLTRYPGFTMLHDPQVHQARAKALLFSRRIDDYRREFAFNHPDAPASIADIVVAGFGGRLYYLWPFLRMVADTSRLVAVHNQFAADMLVRQFPSVPVDIIRMGVPVHRPTTGAAEVRARHGVPPGAIVFAAFGLITPEKRIPSILRSVASLRAELPIHLLLVGDTASHYDVMQEASALGILDRLHTTGYVDDTDLDDYFAAADVCLCLRWPTCRETSGPWVRSLAAGKPAVLTDLLHTRDVPTIDSRTWQPHEGRVQDPPVAVSVDLIEEDRALLLAMRRLAMDEKERGRLGANAWARWRERHTLQHMAEDYVRVIERALASPEPPRTGLPQHLLDDGMTVVREITGRFGVATPW